MSVGGFCVDYGKRQCGCKKCKQKIEKGEVRIAKITANPFSDEGVMKNYHHPSCLFQTFINARATTKIIEDAGDLEGWSEIKSEDQKTILTLIKDTLAQVETKRSAAGNKKSPAKPKTPTKVKKRANEDDSTYKSPDRKKAKLLVEDSKVLPTTPTKDYSNLNHHPDDSFNQFNKICQKIRETSSYLSKKELVAKFFDKGTEKSEFKGDILLWVKLLIPGVVKRVYNMQNKQIVKIFSRIFDTYEEEMLEDLEQGDVAQTISTFFIKSRKLEPLKESIISIQEVNQFLEILSGLSREEDQQHYLHKVAKRCTAQDLKMFIRLIKGDLRIQSGAKHILEALHPEANDAFNSSRNIDKVIQAILQLRKDGNRHGKLNVGASLMQAVQPMLASPCKSIDMAFQKCPNGIYSEIKYDGERVQLHKQGQIFRYFSRSLKPVMEHKVKHFKDFIPQAFPDAVDLILDAEVLLVDTKTGVPLPFGTLGIHKGSDFKDAAPCLFIFDCIFYNGENLMNKPLKERRKFLTDNMVEVKNRIHFSEIREIKKKEELHAMIKETFRKGLEGLMIKDKKSIYEPGKRHWLKIKKDYLNEGAMADTADLVVLGGWYGSGQKGGLISIFLMGCQDKRTGKWCTVSKVHTGHDDATLDRLQTELLPNMDKIKGDYSRVPSWFKVNRGMVPDFVVKDPDKSPVWEITGAEFSKAELHTANGISIRFPRVTKIRNDKSAEDATNLKELEHLYTESKQHIDIDMDDQTEVNQGEDDKEDTAKSNNVDECKPKFKISECVGDLFMSAGSSSLAHCISKDCRLGKGIAKLFREKFGRIKEIEDCKAGIGDVATLKDKQRYIYNLVTKEKYSDKPTYDSLRKSLEKMRDHALTHNVEHISMPRIGCGLDGLQWPAVRTLMKNIFMNTDISVDVYTLGDTSTSNVNSTPVQKSISHFFTSKKDKEDKNDKKSPQKMIKKEMQSYTPSKKELDITPSSKKFKESSPHSEKNLDVASPKKKRRTEIGHGYKVLQPLPDVFTNFKINISSDCPNLDLLCRTVTGYGGVVLQNPDQATHIVYNQGNRLEGHGDKKHVSYKWLQHSIKSQRIQPEKYYLHA